MGLVERFAPGPVALDTSIFIYWMEEEPVYLPLLEPLFEAIDSGRITAVTSGLTLFETLVVPYRDDDTGLARQYETLFSGSRGLTLVSLDTPLLRTAAELRARTGAKTPDALQLGAALHMGCRAFLTNDRRLPEIPGLEIHQLADLLSS